MNILISSKSFGNDPNSSLIRAIKAHLSMLIAELSLKCAAKQHGSSAIIKKLREIEPDISNQESSEKENFNDYWEFKRRALQAFQCTLMLKALSLINKKDLTVVDIGDSAGTHMLYLNKLTKYEYNIDSIGVNLDPRAIEKIKARGQKAILCRAEELDLGNKSVDLFTSFEMVEHLHNPAIFFRRLAKKAKGERMLITVPYLKQSRVGLHKIRQKTNKEYFAEEEHIFELSPEDWTLLIIHSGWKVIYQKIYYQYPKRWPILSQIFMWFWKKSDFEGFWGAILEKDLTLSDKYKDWEE